MNSNIVKHDSEFTQDSESTQDIDNINIHWDWRNVPVNPNIILDWIEPAGAAGIPYENPNDW